MLTGVILKSLKKLSILAISFQFSDSCNRLSILEQSFNLCIGLSCLLGTFFLETRLTEYVHTEFGHTQSKVFACQTLFDNYIFDLKL